MLKERKHSPRGMFDFLRAACGGMIITLRVNDDLLRRMKGRFSRRRKSIQLRKIFNCLHHPCELFFGYYDMFADVFVELVIGIGFCTATLELAHKLADDLFSFEI